MPPAGGTDRIRELYERAVQRTQTERHQFERSWFRNILYYIGQQWISYDRSQRRWVPKRGMKKWIPRPVTNKFATHATAQIQVISAKPPNVSITPSTEDPEDVATAEIGPRILDVIRKEAKADQARRELVAWAVFTGNAFYHPCYDPDPAAGTSFVQHQQCTQCAKTFAPDELVDGDCPKCGPDQAELGLGMIPAIDKVGQPVGEDIPNGKMGLAVYSPFEVYWDLECRNMDECHDLFVRRRYPLSYVRDRWPALKGIESDNSGNGRAPAMTMLRAIATAASEGRTLDGYGGGGGHDKESVTLDFYWRKPDSEFPKGVAAIFGDGVLANEGETDIPYVDTKTAKVLWPWVHFKFDEVPGRMTGKSRLDDVAPKQEQRNRLESMIELIIRRCANPVWLRPKGTGIVEITGEPGQDIEYNSFDGKLKPERVQGENIPTSLIAWLEKIDADMEALAGVYDILRGQAPTGVTAGTALRLLLERANSSFTPVLENLEHAEEEADTLLLAIFRQYGSEERIAKIAGPGKTWEVQRFSNADLTGNVDIEVEAGSAAPKSQVGDQALVQDLAGMMVINPQNPDTQYEILKRFGSTHLLGAIDDNIKQAQRENWRFVNEEKAPVMNPIIDSHQVHITTHLKFALSSDFEVLDPALQAVWLQHIVEHQEAAMALMAAQAGAEPGAPGEGGEGGEGGPKQEGGGGKPPGSQQTKQDNQEAPMPGGPRG